MTSHPQEIDRSANLIKKRPIPIVIQTSKHLIRGKFHVRGVMRVIDELTLEEKFVAVTDAEIINPNGSTLFKTNFVAINRQEILWMAPEENIKGKGEVSRAE